MSNQKNKHRYCYWFEKEKFEKLHNQMNKNAIPMIGAQKMACEVFNCECGFVEPSIWALNDQWDADTWYAASNHAGKNLVVSSFRLGEEWESLLETIFEPVDFLPPVQPSLQEKEVLVKDSTYQRREPVGFGDFPEESRERLVKGIAKMQGTEPEPFCSYLLEWRAVHANFVNPKYRAHTEYDSAPYSVSDSTHISSCCVELCGMFETPEKKFLVRPCMGAVIMNALERDRYYLVHNVKN